MPRSLVLALLLCGCGVLVDTTSGKYFGHESRGVTEYLGIRYAEPPTGARRFAPPVPRAKQAGEQYASAMGASCAEVEDCLFLNVWTPAADAGAKLPVMLFIHGGAYTMGSAPDAATLAKKGNVVTVTINYRLGVFGFMAHPALAAEPGNVAGNYGLLDQQLAMQWVRDNISAFGGDPSNVTLFGESAGAGSVCAHLASPRAKGLFHRALAQSGSCLLGFLPRQRAELTGQHVVDKLSCGADVPKCLREADMKAVRDAVPAKLELEQAAEKWVPVADGDVVPVDTYAAFERGEFNQVPYLSGANEDEGTLFTIGMKLDTRADFEALVRKAAPNAVDEMLRIYGEAQYPTAKSAADALLGDAFVCGQRKQALQVAAHVPDTYLYYFTHANPMLEGNLGATHASEIPYVFGDIGFPLIERDTDRALSDQMIGYWTRFARTGNPNGSGAVEWPRLTVSGGEYQQLDLVVSSGAHLRDARCDELETILPSL